MRTRLDQLERVAAAGRTAAPRLVTEAEFDELSYDDKLRYLRGRLDIRVIDEDDGPTWERRLADLGIDPTEAKAAAMAGKCSSAVMRAYKDYMDAYIERSAARRAAKAGTP